MNAVFHLCELEQHTRVNSHVNGKSSGVGKRLLAHFAFEWFFPSMLTHMYVEVPFFSKQPTNWKKMFNIKLWYSYVCVCCKNDVQILTAVTEAFVALCTFIWLFKSVLIKKKKKIYLMECANEEEEKKNLCRWKCFKWNERCFTFRICIVRLPGGLDVENFN